MPIKKGSCEVASLIQMIGRAARNVDGQVVMYADRVTPSMEKAISETNRRRQLQVAYNLEHGINPQTIRKAVSDILALLHIGGDDSAPVPGKDRRRQKERDKVKSELRTLPQQELSAFSADSGTRNAGSSSGPKV